VSDLWAQILGYELAELQPTTMRTMIDRMHPDDRAESEQRLRRHFAREAETYDCEFRVRHKAGHWIWLRGRGRVATWTPDGGPALMFGTHVDITVRKELEQAAASASKGA
jgi:PAS domain S-box-containing protein